MVKRTDAPRVAIITGGGQGIGRVFAQAFAAIGDAVVVADINGPRCEAVAQEIDNAGGTALPVVADVSSEASVAGMLASIERELGRADILVNNAALFSTLDMRPFEEIPLEEWERVLRVNVTGAFLCARAVLPLMRRYGFGRIVNISSGAVTLGRPNYLHYITSKSALIGMTRSMARELGKDGITVNAILPGSTVTEIDRKTVTEAQRARIIERQCIARSQVPDDLTSTLLYLAANETGFVTGQCITVDGGATHP